MKRYFFFLKEEPLTSTNYWPKKSHEYVDAEGMVCSRNAGKYASDLTYVCDLSGSLGVVPPNLDSCGSKNLVILCF